MLAALQDRRAAGGGFRESGPHPYQANCHMHLFESALAWEPVGGRRSGRRSPTNWRASP